jgi:hypothetical protein
MTAVVKTLAERLGIEDFYPWPHDGGHIDAVLNHPSTANVSVASLRASGGMAARNILTRCPHQPPLRDTVGKDRVLFPRVRCRLRNGAGCRALTHGPRSEFVRSN